MMIWKYLILVINLIIINYLISGEAEILIGKYSDELLHGNLIVPRKVNHEGEHISHNLTHHHDESTKGLNYQILVGNETLHLELEPHNYFVAPAMVIERHRRDIRSRKRPSANLNCHYHGKVRGHEESNVALSACNGISGHIRTNTGEYYVEPSKNHQLSEEGHPHVVFQRSSVQDKKVQSKRKKRRRKKKRAISNCGTKEPRRRTETRIEWQPQGKVIVQGGRKVRRHHPHNSGSSPNLNSLQHQHHHQHEHHHHQPQHPPILSSSSSSSSSQKNRRYKRSISSPRHVEALIVADPTMVAFHDDVETYLLTIMNMVSSFYKDPTIGNSIHIVVVKIVLVEDEESHPDLNLTENAQRNLELFCSWQHKLNSVSEKDPHHHDVAILITRRNICGNDCMTLGLANVGGMCKPRKSCSVNEDNGIMLSHTIAHELGHNFGMYHDTLKIGCHGRVGPIVHIMTPNFGADTVQVAWSNCSRKYITHFLDQGLGKCLDDFPSQVDFQYPELPPGALYNAELQCRLQFNLTDDEVHVCSSPHEICTQLWCQVDGECVTNMRPTAPGTSCGTNKWCQNGKCVPVDKIPSPVDGGWGKWSNWSKCSRTCGSGISIQSRSCDNPAPANGGSFCIGERKRYKVCNTHPCPDGEPTFRAVQCSEYNNSTYNGEKYTWLPYFDRYSPCKLFCTDSDDTVIANWADSAKDGTPCKLGTNNMCIGGICKKVGCDWIVDSNKSEDRCGVCGGTNVTCEIIKAEYKNPFNISDGYIEITTIPTGSRHILIEETSKSPNFLSVGQMNSSNFYLNGERLISMSGEYIIADAESLYDREDEMETIRIPGPIRNSIVVYALVRNSQKNGGIRYEFTLPSKMASTFAYAWKLANWTNCSVSCGGGIQHRIPMCYQDDKIVVDEMNCWSNAKNDRPHEIVQACNENHCPARWWTGPWTSCTANCKKKSTRNPVKRRPVMCIDPNEVLLPESNCQSDLKPTNTESCDPNIPICKLAEDVEDTNNLI